DAFHEAIGDTIALSVTPPYLKQLGLIDKVPDQRADIGFLLNRALDKFRVKLSRRTTTKRGGICVRSTRALRRPFHAANRISIPVRSITCRRTRRTRATSSPRFYSFNFIARCVAKPGSMGRFTSARSTAIRKPARN